MSVLSMVSQIYNSLKLKSENPRFQIVTQTCLFKIPNAMDKKSYTLISESFRRAILRAALLKKKKNGTDLDQTQNEET